jgi:3-oxoacyl-[acyl-carrier-protein] synthase-3
VPIAALTLDAVASHFPERTTTVEERAEALGLKPAQVHMFRRLHGLDQLRYDPDMSLYDLVVPPARAALETVDPASVRYLVYVHAMQQVTPSTTDAAQEIKRALGLRDTTAFALTQQSCAAPLTAIDAAGALLRADGDPDARALIVAGEKVFSKESQLIANACVLGEGAAACVVSLDGPGDPVRSYAARTFGEFSDGVAMTPAMHRQVSEMRGRVIHELMATAAAEGGGSLDTVHLVIPHNPNTTLWNEVGKELGFAPGRVFLGNVPRYAHCMSADVLINYVTLRDEGLLEPGRDYLFFALGLGMTFASMMFTHRG